MFACISPREFDPHMWKTELQLYLQLPKEAEYIHKYALFDLFNPDADILMQLPVKTITVRYEGNIRQESIFICSLISEIH